MAYLDNTFGIEIECYLPEGGTAAGAAAAVTARLGSLCAAENYNHYTQPHWKIVTDGSLGDYARGIELVSPILTGEAGLDATERAMEALTDYGCTVSKKCGLHVHVGAAGSPLGFFKNLLKLYAGYEPTIDRFMPASRRASANMYCRSVTNIAPAKIDAATDFQGLLRLMSTQGEARYHKLNLAAYRRHQTVEFRQHSGTLDGTKARRWTTLCLRMVEAAKEGRTVNAGAARNKARAGSKSFLVGEMMLRASGVTGAEAQAATGWPSISLPQQARNCGLTYTTQRTGREVRYFAQATGPAATPLTLDGLFEMIGCEAADQDYFRTRTANLSGAVQWAA